MHITAMVDFIVIFIVTNNFDKKIKVTAKEG